MKLREGEQRIRETKRERDRLEKKERQTEREVDLALCVALNASNHFNNIYSSFGARQ